MNLIKIKLMIKHDIELRTASIVIFLENMHNCLKSEDGNDRLKVIY